MQTQYDISGTWNFKLDGEKLGLNDDAFKRNGYFNDTIKLPSTTACEKKGSINPNRETGFLTEEYKFSGYAWFNRVVTIDQDLTNKHVELFLERTRKTTVWINGNRLETLDSLSAPHVYDVTKYVRKGENDLTILVDNTDYPTAGGHMTSQDTQTNWNGITGRMELRVYNDCHIVSIKTYPDIHSKSVTLKILYSKPNNEVVTIKGVTKSLQGVQSTLEPKQFNIVTDSQNSATITIDLGTDATLWSEYNPVIYELSILSKDGVDTVNFGLREFTTDSHNFLINGKKTLLRGKHDGMIFPIKAYAPTTVEEWVEVFKISKSYGINHYRFHTCCPPDEAFTGADLVGIYLQPEINFWGTLCGTDDENYNAKEQEFLIQEGFRILECYGNHPSFAMFSLGNELWGSKERMNEILGKYKAIDRRHLYTQGSNNFQWYPCIVENDDFFSGVRFSKERQIRGSYAMCDVPLGHVQTMKPSTSINYDSSIFPEKISSTEGNVTEDGYIKIQYGTGMKLIKADELEQEFVPNVPVVSHEIGQYETFPDFDEIQKYTGVLKARNFEVFKERLEATGMLPLAHKFFMASGKLAVECYKLELESAFRSKYIAGFQLLDIQDFTGQGTALVGVLNAFMENKGTVTPEEWRTFCSDAVLLGEFEKYTYQASEEFNTGLLISYYRDTPLTENSVEWQLLDSSNKTVYSGKVDLPNGCYGLVRLNGISFNMPNVEVPTEFTLQLDIPNTDITKQYTFMVYPKLQDTPLSDTIQANGNTLNVTTDLTTALERLSNGERVLFLPNEIKQSIKGFYCTDFWCYPMFRTISESMNREIPVGTMGLLIDNTHPVLKEFPSEYYSTPQWYNLVTHSECAILDDTAKDFYPIVQMIDNFERNHKLGILFEATVGDGRLLVCTSRLSEISNEPEVKQYIKSIIDYATSNEFNPKHSIDTAILKKVF